MNALIDAIKGSTGGLFADMVDDKKDVLNFELMSLCLRCINRDFTVSETSMGFIYTPFVTGESMYKQLRDTLSYLALSLDQCVGQGYDGGVEHDGLFKGTVY